MKSQAMENYQQNNSDEIDLFDIVEKIWAGKKVIAGIMLVSAIIAFVALKMTPSYYGISVTIDRASADQLRPLAPSLLGSNEYQVPAPDENKIYGKILLQADSIALLRAFWENETGKALNLDAGTIKSDVLQEFDRFSKSFILTGLNPKTPEITARKITLEHRNSLEGIKLLNNYVAFLNKRSLGELTGRLKEAYTANLNALDIAYNARNSIEQRKLSDALINLHENSKIAASLGIKETPFKELENIQLKVLDSRDYLLGTKVLAQQIDILLARQGKSLAPFSLDLRNMETWRDQMTSDLQRLNDSTVERMLFVVVNKPEASFAPIKPKKSLIFVGVVLLSGCLGVLLVLIMSALKNRKAIAS